MAEQKDATGVTTVASSYEEAVKQAAARRVAIGGVGYPMPDTPQGVPHLNPALTPAPARAEIPERIPVPVINDPGLVGANPPLHDLNKQYRADIAGVPIDDTGGQSLAGQQEAVKAAAQATQDSIAEKADEQASKAVADAVDAAKRTKPIEEPKKPAPTKPADAAK